MLRELSQTSHVGGGLRIQDNNMKEQVDVELFNLYAIRKYLNHPTCLDANISPRQLPGARVYVSGGAISTFNLVRYQKSDNSCTSRIFLHY